MACCVKVPCSPVVGPDVNSGPESVGACLWKSIYQEICPQLQLELKKTKVMLTKGKVLDVPLVTV